MLCDRSNTLTTHSQELSQKLPTVKILEFRYNSQDELIREISIDIIYGLYDTSCQAVQMNIRTLNRDVFKAILDQNKEHIIEETHRPFFWTYNLKLDAAGNFNIERLNNLRCPSVGFTSTSSQAKLSNAESVDHVMKVFNCLVQIDPSTSEVAQSFFTYITTKERSLVKNCITLCKNGIYESEAFSLLPKEITKDILSLAITGNDCLYGKYAVSLLNEVLPEAVEDCEVQLKVV